MTCKQFYIVLSIFIISLKFQKMPGLICGELGKDSYLLAILYFLIDFILVLLALWVAKRTRGVQFDFKDNAALRWFKRLLLVFIAIYFLMQSVLFYETTQDLFAHILFDNLPWTIFSLLLIAEVFYLANSGLKNITLNYELYSLLIFISLFVIGLFGGLRTDYSSILPLQNINFSGILNNFANFNFWFGDFIVVYLLAREAKDVKYKWTMLVYGISAIFVVVLFIEFWGIYQSYAPMQPSLISVLSEQSMLGVNIGRVDWFFILFTQIGTILSSGLCLHFAKKCISEIFPKVKKGYFAAGLVFILYLLDVFLLVDLHIKKIVFVRYISYFALAVKVIVVIVGLVIGTCCAKSNNKNKLENDNQSDVKESKKVKNKKYATSLKSKQELDVSKQKKNRSASLIKKSQQKSAKEGL